MKHLLPLMLVLSVTAASGQYPGLHDPFTMDTIGSKAYKAYKAYATLIPSTELHPCEVILGNNRSVPCDSFFNVLGHAFDFQTQIDFLMRDDLETHRRLDSLIGEMKDVPHWKITEPGKPKLLDSNWKVPSAYVGNPSVILLDESGDFYSWGRNKSAIAPSIIPPDDPNEKPVTGNSIRYDTVKVILLEYWPRATDTDAGIQAAMDTLYIRQFGYLDHVITDLRDGWAVWSGGINSRPITYLAFDKKTVVTNILQVIYYDAAGKEINW